MKAFHFLVLLVILVLPSVFADNHTTSIQELDEPAFSFFTTLLVVFIVLLTLAFMYYVIYLKNSETSGFRHLSAEDKDTLKEHMRVYIRNNKTDYSRSDLYNALAKTNSPPELINEVLDEELGERSS